MLSMVGTVESRTVRPGLDDLTLQLRGYRAVRVSDSEAVLLIPTVGAVLVDTQPGRIQFELAGRSRGILDDRISSLADELRLDEVSDYLVEWKPATRIPLPFR
jgi:hypothetical protein